MELELPQLKEYHTLAFRANCGRSALAIAAAHLDKIWIPIYSCDAVVNALKGKEIVYYSIDRDFKPIIPTYNPGKREGILLIKYFGVYDVDASIPNAILDLTQAFYDDISTYPELESGTQAFNSARKWFGVPDGAYLYTYKEVDVPQGTTEIADYHHLLTRIESGAESAYNAYQSHENGFKGIPPTQMSTLTRRLLSSINYHEAAAKRRENYNYLCDHLKDNLLKVPSLSGSPNVPFAFPYLVANAIELKKKLLLNKIYIPTLWHEVKAEPSTFEHELKTNLLPLPIDQRYDLHDMMRIVELIGGKVHGLNDSELNETKEPVWIESQKRWSVY